MWFEEALREHHRQNPIAGRGLYEKEFRSFCDWAGREFPEPDVSMQLIIVGILQKCFAAFCEGVAVGESR